MAHIVSLYFWAEWIITLLAILKIFHTHPSPKRKKIQYANQKLVYVLFLGPSFQKFIPHHHQGNSRKNFSESSFCLKSHCHTFPVYFLSLEYFFLKLSHFFWVFLCEISMLLFYITLKKEFWVFFCDEQTHILSEKAFHDSKQKLFMGLIYIFPRIIRSSVPGLGVILACFHLEFFFFFLHENGITSRSIHSRQKTSVMQKIKIYVVLPRKAEGICNILLWLAQRAWVRG